MDTGDIKLYFSIPILYDIEANPNFDRNHNDCQHCVSLSNKESFPKIREKVKIGSKKLLFLHGSKKEWVDARVKGLGNLDKESDLFVKDVVDQVINEFWIQNDNESSMIKNEKNSSLSFYNHVNFDILHLLLIEGSICHYKKKL